MREYSKSRLAHTDTRPGFQPILEEPFVLVLTYQTHLLVALVIWQSLLLAGSMAYACGSSDWLKLQSRKRMPRRRAIRTSLILLSLRTLNKVT